jgi:beta-lactamase class A
MIPILKTAAVCMALVLPAGAEGKKFVGLPAVFAGMEKGCGGRLGVAVLDTATGETSGYRAGERFAMCSTFKMLLAAAVLQRVDAGREQPERRVRIPEKPLLANSPLTEEHAGGEMTVAELCHAILTRSDNTGANLLLETVGGPEGITAFARSLGDETTRLDRNELSLNEATPGDPRDTTSPAAMLEDLRKLLLGDVLTKASRDQLDAWMAANKTGDKRLRAGLPAGWTAGDKTGSNGRTTANDVAIFRPDGGRAPVLVSVYLTECEGPEEKRGAVIAEVGRLVVAALGN